MNRPARLSLGFGRRETLRQNHPKGTPAKTFAFSAGAPFCLPSKHPIPPPQTAGTVARVAREIGRRGRPRLGRQGVIPLAAHRAAQKVRAVGLRVDLPGLPRELPRKGVGQDPHAPVGANMALPRQKSRALPPPRRETPCGKGPVLQPGSLRPCRRPPLASPFDPPAKARRPPGFRLRRPGAPLAPPQLPPPPAHPLQPGRPAAKNRHSPALALRRHRHSLRLRSLRRFRLPVPLNRPFRPCFPARGRNIGQWRSRPPAGAHPAAAPAALLPRHLPLYFLFARRSFAGAALFGHPVLLFQGRSQPTAQALRLGRLCCFPRGRPPPRPCQALPFVLPPWAKPVRCRRFGVCLVFLGLLAPVRRLLRPNKRFLPRKTRAAQKQHRALPRDCRRKHRSAPGQRHGSDPPPQRRAQGLPARNQHICHGGVHAREAKVRPAFCQPDQPAALFGDRPQGQNFRSRHNGPPFAFFKAYAAARVKMPGPSCPQGQNAVKFLHGQHRPAPR